MKAKEAQDLGQRIAALVRRGEIEPAYALLAPVLAKRTPFPILGRIGTPVRVLRTIGKEVDRVACQRR